MERGFQMNNNHYHPAHKTYIEGVYQGPEPMAIHGYCFNKEDARIAERRMYYMSMGPRMFIPCPLKYIVCPITEYYSMDNLDKLPWIDRYIHFERDKLWRELLEHDKKEQERRPGNIKFYEDNNLTVPEYLVKDLPNMSVEDGLIRRWCKGTIGES